MDEPEIINRNGYTVIHDWVNAISGMHIVQLRKDRKKARSTDTMGVTGPRLPTEGPTWNVSDR